MKIKISKSQWEEIGRIAGWKNFQDYQRRYDNAEPEPDKWVCDVCGHNANAGFKKDKGTYCSEECYKKKDQDKDL